MGLPQGHREKGAGPDESCDRLRHGGYQLKEELKTFIASSAMKWRTTAPIPRSVDYLTLPF